MIRGIIPAVVGCFLVSLLLPGYFVLENPTPFNINLFIGAAGVYALCAVAFVRYVKKLAIRKEASFAENVLFGYRDTHRGSAGD